MSRNSKPGSRTWKWVIAVVAGLVVLLGGAYVAAYFVAGNRVPANASVEGVPIGGMSPAQAVEKLKSELEPLYAEPIVIPAPEGEPVEVQPLESGLSLDFEAAVRDAGGGFSWNPVDIVTAFTGGGNGELPRRVDEGALTRTLESRAAAFVAEPVPATLSYEGAKIARTPAANGTELDVAATVEEVSRAMEEHRTQATAVLKETEPEVTDAMVDAAVESYAGPAISAPVTISVGELSFQVTPEQIAEVTTLSFDQGTFQHTTDADRLMEVTADARAALKLPKTKDASYTFKEGKVVVVPSVDGETIPADGLAAALEEAAVKDGAERTAAVAPIKEEAEFTTAEAQKVAPREVIGEFTTKYPHASYRNTNLGRAAKTVDGTVLLPGETFSLNDTLGPRNRANGYVDGYVINGGVLVQESGGGISQSATTLYNAAFFAGLEDVEHKPHSLYFDRYPAGREATIYYGSVDMRFKNNTAYPVYIQGYINASSSGKKGSITFKIWSIPTWDKVVSTDLVKSDFYTGSTRTLTNKDCKPQAPIRGFTVTWSRLFYKDGNVAKKENYSWKYSAGDKIVCG